ncbi:hypothetical protein AALI21_10335 [Corynebacteriaceae bacterium 6-324]
MCGACGVKPDWAGPVVAGPIRRRDIARCLNGLVTSIKVSDISRGWMVKKPTGASTPAQTLDELIQVSIPRARHHSWEELEQALLNIPAPLRIEEVSTPWLSTDIHDDNPREVLTKVKHLPAHMKLAAFVLGAHTCGFEGTVSATFGEGQHLQAHPGHLSHP